MEKKNHQSTIDRILFSEIFSLTNTLYYISEALNMYDKNFTKEEATLYNRLIASHSSDLNNFGSNIYTLMISLDLQMKGSDIYQENIWKLENELYRINQGQLTNQERIHSLGNVVKEQADKLTDLFIVEQLGTELTNPDVIEKIIEILEGITDEIDKNY